MPFLFPKTESATTPPAKSEVSKAALSKSVRRGTSAAGSGHSVPRSEYSLAALGMENGVGHSTVGSGGKSQKRSQPRSRPMATAGTGAQASVATQPQSQIQESASNACSAVQTPQARQTTAKASDRPF